MRTWLVDGLIPLRSIGYFLSRELVTFVKFFLVPNLCRILRNFLRQYHLDISFPGLDQQQLQQQQQHYQPWQQHHHQWQQRPHLVLACEWPVICHRFTTPWYCNHVRIRVAAIDRINSSNTNSWQRQRKTSLLQNPLVLYARATLSSLGYTTVESSKLQGAFLPVGTPPACPVHLPSIHHLRLCLMPLLSFVNFSSA
jgi:hypothetical protein